MPGKRPHLKLVLALAVMALVNLPADANRLKKLVRAEEKKATTHCDGKSKKCGKRCIKYRHHRRHKKVCKKCRECGRQRCKRSCKTECKPPINVVLTVKDPCCGGKIEVPVCVPHCCKEAPKAKCSKGLLGSATTFTWCCGFKVRVVIIKKNGNLVVHSYGKL